MNDEQLREALVGAVRGIVALLVTTLGKGLEPKPMRYIHALAHLQTLLDVAEERGWGPSIGVDGLQVLPNKDGGLWWLKKDWLDKWEDKI